MTVVAPRAGAWIETGRGEQIYHKRKVAPRAGAWIETTSPSPGDRANSSPLAQGRGLKLVREPQLQRLKGRPSRRGVD